MAKKTEEVGAEFLLELIATIDENERAALDAIRRFVAKVDQAIPRSGKKSAPRRQVEVVEAALKMIEQLLGVSNDVAQRVVESVRVALPDLERNARAVAKKPAPKASAERPAKKPSSKAGTSSKVKKAATKKQAPPSPA